MRVVLVTAAAACLLAACNPSASTSGVAASGSAASAAPATPSTAPPAAAIPQLAAAATPAGWTEQTSQPLGIAFALPAGRSVGPCTGDFAVDGDTPCLVVTGTHEGSPATYLQLTGRRGALDAVAAEQAGFEANAEGRLMTTYGRFEPQPVERFTTPAGQGLRAAVTCGTEDENGFHAAGGTCFYGVVGDGTRAVVAVSDGRFGEDADTRRIIETVRFLPAAG